MRAPRTLPPIPGYWLVDSRGGIFAFGGAGFYGSTSKFQLNHPMVGMQSTPDGKGYWLVASDGGVFPFGDAHFFGSLGGVSLSAPIVGIEEATDDAVRVPNSVPEPPSWTLLLLSLGALTAAGGGGLLGGRGRPAAREAAGAEAR